MLSNLFYYVVIIVAKYYSIFRRAAFALCRTDADEEIVMSHELEISTLATLSSLKVCIWVFHLPVLDFVRSMFMIRKVVLSSLAHVEQTLPLSLFMSRT